MKSNKTAAPTVDRNPITRKKHQHEVLWQITIPLIAGLVIVLALAAFSAFATSAGTKSQMADISLVTLIIPALIFGLFTLVVLGMLAYGVIRLIIVLPALFYRLQQFLSLAGFRISKVTNVIVEPFIRAKSFSASGRAFRRNLVRRG